MTSRRLRRPEQRAAPSRLSSRVDVCPPQLWPSSLTLWGRMQRWLMRDSPWTPDAARPLGRLALARREFQQLMDPLRGPDAARLACQTETARSLRELWHLRSTLYGLLALQFSQAEAERCLATLNRHFPTRASRFGLLDQ